MSDYPVQGQIEEARKSQSGKTVGVKIGGKWYQSKDFSLEQKVGSVISGVASDSDFNGKTMHWLNGYTVDSQAAPSGGNGTNYQPMVSNLAAHLISADKSPSELPKWFEMCKSVLEGRAQETPRDADPDDEIPW